MLSQKETDRLDYGNTTMTLNNQTGTPTPNKETSFLDYPSTAALISKATPEEFRCPELAG